MFEYFELAGEEDNFDANTVSGWVIEHLGEIPHAGYQFEYLNLAVEVLKSTVKRVLQIKITVLDKIENESDNDEE
jgi:CBS domain containing-hemolysin-like protein